MATKASSPSQGGGPNNISERIMKCLIFIYIRLHRTSRALDLDKSGHFARITHSSPASISFRADGGWNPNTSRGFRRESRQRDPYAIFEPEESVLRDIGRYKNLVVFTANSLDPKCISVSNSTPLFQKLKVLMGSLEKVDLRGMTYQQKLAFWINIYNACVMHAYLKNGVPSNREKLLEVMDKATLDIGGHILDARTIESVVLRNSSTIHKASTDGMEYGVASHHILESSCQNVRFALCSGSRSCPAVRIYRAEGVEAELEKAKTEYLQAAIVTTTVGRIALPGLAAGGRRVADFGKDAALCLLSDLCHSLPASGSLRKSMVEALRSLSGGNRTSILDITPINFEFGYLLFV